jgi:hypothetical protein
MSVTLSPIGGAGAQFFDNNGDPLSGGKFYTYQAGTSTPQTTYTSSAGTTAHTNPIVLDAAGRVPGGEIWLTASETYKFVLKTSADVLIATYDNITGTSFVTNASFVTYDPAGAGAVSTTVQAQLRLTVNASNYGTDIGVAINRAIAALPALGGIVDCRGFSGTCTTATSIVANKSVKLIFGNLVLSSTASPVIEQQAQNLTIEGIGPYGTIIQSNTNGAHAIYSNPVPFTPPIPLNRDELATLTVRDLYIRDNLTVTYTTTRTSGDGIRNTFPAVAGGSNTVFVIDNVKIYGFMDGIHAEQTTTSTFNAVSVLWNRSDSFHFAKINTSLTLTGTYSFASQGDGYYFETTYYSTLNGTASDVSWGNGYYFKGCDSITMNSPGCEQPGSGIPSSSAILLEGCQFITVNSPFLSGQPTSVSSHGITVNFNGAQPCRSLVINGGKVGQATGTEFTGYGLNVAANGSAGTIAVLGFPSFNGTLGGVSDPSFLVQYVTNNPQVSVFEGFVQTTNATITIVFQDSVGANTMATYEATVSAIQTGGSSGTVGTSAAYIGRETVKVIGGVSSAVGTGFVDVYSEEDAAAWDCYTAISAGVLYVYVVGEANKTVKWYANVTKNLLTTAAYPAI